MSTFTVKINTDNSAFEGGDCNHELARILRQIADDIEDQGISGFYETIRDINGNDVGRWAHKEDDGTRAPR